MQKININDQYNFENDQVYQVELGKNDLKFGNIPFKKLCTIYQDGRIAGLVVEYLLEGIFKNIQRSPSEKSSFDLIEKIKGYRYQVKTVTRRGTSTCPSCLVGVGRKYNVDKHIDSLLNLDFFIDIRDFPIINIYCLEADENCLLEQRISVKKFDRIIKKKLGTL